MEKYGLVGLEKVQNGYVFFFSISKRSSKINCNRKYFHEEKKKKKERQTLMSETGDCSCTHPISVELMPFCF